MKNPRGFTLVELLVVLVILAALTGVAITSVDVYEGQSRYEATQRTLQNVEDAVIGPANVRDADGSPLITGFVADIGRPPKAIDVSGQLLPAELWDNPGGLLAFGVRQANAAFVANVNDRDDDVYVPCGWRGPYIRLGIGQTRLLDGWGNAFDLLDETRAAVAASDDILTLRSRGADNPDLNVAATSDYKEELYLNLRTNATASYPAVASDIDRFHASTVQVTVTDPGTGSGFPEGGTPVVIRYFGPDPATGGIKVISSGDLPTVPSAAVTHSFNDPAITIGPRVFRAYQGTKKSNVLRVTLPAGGKAIELKLR